MKASLRLLISITWPLLLAAGIFAAPAQAALQPAPCGSGVRDFTCDGRPDLLAQDSHGTLWLYPNEGDGHLKPRIRSGTGWHYTPILEGVVPGPAQYTGVFARDREGTLWAIPSNGHGGWLKRIRTGGGWNQMTSIIPASHEPALLAIDRSGTLWRYPYEVRSHSIHWLTRQRLGAGWAGHMLVASRGYNDSDFLARDTHGTLWPYYFTYDSHYGPHVHRSPFNYGSGWGKYRSIVEDGDFVNVDGYIDFVATDNHGGLWLYASERGLKHRVQIGHGFNGYTIG